MISPSLLGTVWGSKIWRMAVTVRRLNSKLRVRVGHFGFFAFLYRNSYISNLSGQFDCKFTLIILGFIKQIC